MVEPRDQMATDEKESIYKAPAVAFRRYPWPEIIEGCKIKQCDEYARAFYAEAQKREAEGDELGRKVHAVLAVICHYAFRPDEKGGNPFGPVFRSGTTRSPIPEDMGEKSLSLLRAIAKRAKDPEFRSRIFDLIWVLGRDFSAARKAAEAYTASACQLITSNESTAFNLPRIERALQLGRRLGRERNPFLETLQFVNTRLDLLRETEKELESARLLEFLYNNRAGDPKALGDHSAEIAERLEKEEPGFARRYWKLAHRFYCNVQDEPDLWKLAARRAAETYVAEAEAALKRKIPSHSVAASHLAQAIDGLRKAGGASRRIGALKKRMNAYQKESLNEMGRVSHQWDLSDAVERVRSAVSGKSLEDALLWLAAEHRPIDRKKHRARTIRNFRRFPLQHLIGGVIIDPQGRPVARKPVASLSDEGQFKEALEAQMFLDARIDRTVRAQGLLLPAIDQIRREHEPRLTDLAFLALDNPFVPYGREDLFACGLLAGLRQDFIEACHYLIPQVENSIRAVLEQRGVITAGLDHELLQSNYGLKRLLTGMPQVNRIFGGDLVFDLRGLLIEKLDANLRNEFAHGLMSYQDFHRYEVVYLWGLCLRLCALPLIITRNQEAQKRSSNDRRPRSE